MAIRSLETYAITEILSEYLEVDNEIWLYSTCRGICHGNRRHIAMLNGIRNDYYLLWGPPTLRDDLWEDEPVNPRGRVSGMNGHIVERPEPWYHTWASMIRFPQLYVRRPETIPPPSPREDDEDGQPQEG